MFIKKATENAFLKMWKVFFHVKNAFHNLVNAFINRKKLSRFRGTHSLPFHTFFYGTLSSQLKIRSLYRWKAFWTVL